MPEGKKHLADGLDDSRKLKWISGKRVWVCGLDSTETG